MDLLERAPPVAVDEAEYIRLLGFPRGHQLDGRAFELAAEARAWYARHGRPWIYAREAATLELAPGVIRVEGTALHSPRLERMLGEAGAHSVFLVAISAGPEVEQHAHRAWLAEKPDEYFFLEMFGSAVVEQLTTTAGARLCAWADTTGMAVLPHYSPGYPEWDIGEQHALFGLLPTDGLPGSLDVLESGMLRPKKALLAVFGVTRHVDRVKRAAGLVPCENCSFTPCQYRRAPYRRTAAGLPAPDRRVAPRQPAAAYSTSVRALRRWAAERLTLSRHADGSIDATFCYDGSTCSNMGRAIALEYQVTLGPRDGGFPIRAQRCRPAAGHDGYKFMCEYARDEDAFVAAIDANAPLAGQPLDAVFLWARPQLGPGCVCELDSRQHKWGLVLETIHYALAQEKG